MALNMGQWTVAASATTSTLILPAGPYQLILYNTGANPLYMGTGQNVSPTNGLVMHSVPTSFQGFQASGVQKLWVANTAATGAGFNYVISTMQS